MKFVLSALCLVAVLAVVCADTDSGHFIPKSFYTLDSDGHKSDVHPISKRTAHYLRRLRRQTVTSSSSSSSSSSSDGGPVFFSAETINSHTPDNVGFASRFGGAESSKPVTHVVKTTGVIHTDGKIYYDTKEREY